MWWHHGAFVQILSTYLITPKSMHNFLYFHGRGCVKTLLFGRQGNRGRADSQVSLCLLQWICKALGTEAFCE